MRLYEMLLRAVFDSLDEAEYVPNKEAYLRTLEVLPAHYACITSCCLCWLLSKWLSKPAALALA